MRITIGSTGEKVVIFKLLFYFIFFNQNRLFVLLLGKGEAGVFDLQSTWASYSCYMWAFSLVLFGILTVLVSCRS